MGKTLLSGGVTRNLARRPAARAIHSGCPLSPCVTAGVASLVERPSREGGAWVARAADDVVHLPGGAPRPTPEPRGRAVGPRRDDALDRRDGRRRRDPRARRLLPLGARQDLRGAAHAVRARRADRHHHRRRGAPARRASSTRSAARCTCATSSTRCPRRPAPSHYAKIVADAALRRRLIGAAADIIDTAYDGRRRRRPRSPTTPSSGSTTSPAARTTRRRRSSATWSTRRWSTSSRIQNRESAYTGIPTGFRDLDDLTSGLQPGNLVSSRRAPASGSPRSR